MASWAERLKKADKLAEKESARAAKVAAKESKRDDQLLRKYGPTLPAPVAAREAQHDKQVADALARRAGRTQATLRFLTGTDDAGNLPSWFNYKPSILDGPRVPSPAPLAEPYIAPNPAQHSPSPAGGAGGTSYGQSAGSSSPYVTGTGYYDSTSAGYDPQLIGPNSAYGQAARAEDAYQRTLIAKPAVQLAIVGGLAVVGVVLLVRASK
jgi:hypothetical protein